MSVIIIRQADPLLTATEAAVSWLISLTNSLPSRDWHAYWNWEMYMLGNRHTVSHCLLSICLCLSLCLSVSVCLIYTCTYIHLLSLSLSLSLSHTHTHTHAHMHTHTHAHVHKIDWKGKKLNNEQPVLGGAEIPNFTLKSPPPPLLPSTPHQPTHLHGVTFWFVYVMVLGGGLGNKD